MYYYTTKDTICIISSEIFDEVLYAMYTMYKSHGKYIFFFETLLPVAVVFEILDNDIILKEKYNNAVIMNSIYKYNLQTIFSTTTLGFFAF